MQLGISRRYFTSSFVIPSKDIGSWSNKKANTLVNPDGSMDAADWNTIKRSGSIYRSREIEDYKWVSILQSKERKHWWW